MSPTPPSVPPRHTCCYQPYYCEENVWQLCAAPNVPGSKYVVAISNVLRACPMWAQRAAPAGYPVVWDYHVIFAIDVPADRGTSDSHGAGAWVLDLDSSLPWPCKLEAYLQASFPDQASLRPEAHPMFRVFEAETFLRHFTSDRAHMRTEEGTWRAPPPPWPAPFGRAPRIPLFPTVLDMEDTSHDSPGILVDPVGLHTLFAPATLLS